MGILTTLKSTWKAASTAEKINMVLDVICGFGAAAIGGQVTKRIAPGMNRVERICSGIVMGGLGMAAGEAAAKAYGPYTKAAGDIIDTVKQKNAQSKTKEDSGDGEYTRY